MKKLKSKVRFFVSAFVVSMLLMAGVMVYADDVESSYEIGEGSYDIVVSGRETYCKIVPDQDAILIVVSSSEEDTYGNLYDGEMNELTSDDDSAGNGQFMLRHTLAAGETYYVGVRYYYEENSGTIPISVDLVTSDYTGWKQIGPQMGYVVEGKFVYGWKTIDGDTYYFYYGSGLMVENKTTSIADPEDGRLYLYRFDENGHMVTGWYQHDSSSYYYDEKGHAGQGITTIGGEQYYFGYEGRMYTNYILTENQKLYWFGEDGKLEETADIKEGWIKFKNKWFYVEDDTFVTDTWKTINGKRYYFNYNGEMLADTFDNLCDPEDENWYYFRFASDGRVVTGWYTEENGDKYYYDNKGHAVSGILKIDDREYYFDYNGRLDKELGSNELKEGNMDITTSGGEVYYKYVAAVDAQLIVYSSSEEDPYGNLYDADMNRLTYNDDGGEGNNFRITYKVTAGNTYYIGIRFCDETEGVIPVTTMTIQSEGFVKLGSYWYYVENGDFVNGFKTVDGHRYYFDYEGRMLTNATFEDYDEEEQSYNYRADSSGYIVTGWYEDEDGSWYFYDKNGRAARGMTTVGKAVYYFDYEGRMCTNCTVTENQKLYWFREDGRLAETADIKEGWMKFKGSWYYIENGDFVAGQLKTISNKNYYFDYNGVMIANEVVNIYNQKSGREEYYRFNANGQAITGWYETEDGSWYFYDKNGCAAQGITTVGKAIYYFDYTGKMIADLNGARISVGDSDIEVSGGTVYAKFIPDKDMILIVYSRADQDTYGYLFDENMSELVYNDDGGNGNNFFYHAKVAAGNTYYIAVRYYDTTKTGTIPVSVVGFDSDGWKQIDDDWFYVKNGELIVGSWRNIGKVLYYFDENGKMAVNTTEYAWDYEGDEAHYYRFDSKGRIVTGWYNVGERKYYYDEKGRAASGMTTLEGATYYFDTDGYMYTDRISSDDKNFYYFGEDGKLSETKEITEGWIKFRGSWYYVENGSFLTNVLRKIGKKTYYFDNTGKMAVNAVHQIYDQESQNYFYYRFDSNGYIVTGWYTADAYSKYYYDEAGRAANGIITLEGATYYFGFDGRMNYDTVTSASAKLYYFGADGKLAESEELKEGWIKFRDHWYYVQDGELVTHQVLKIGKNYYGFNNNGIMYINSSFEIYNGSSVYYRAKKDGTLYTNAWVEVNNSRYYYGEDGKAYIGAKKVGDTTYVFDRTGQVRTNTVLEVNNKVYRIDADGAYSEINSGWVLNPGINRWVYVENSHIVNSGVKTISGSKYVFGSGYMIDNQVYYDYNTEAYYIATKGGKLYTEKGWYTFNGAWYYVNEDGTLHKGLLNLKGTKYYLNPAMLAYREIMIDDDNNAYTVTPAGVLKANVADGLYHINYRDNSVVYVSDGKVVVNSWKKINGAWYYFGYNGVRYEYSVHKIEDELYYFDADGKMLTDSWIRLYDSMYYAKASGKLATGSQTIDGLTYVFNTNGKLIGGVVYDNSKYSVYKDGVFVADIAKEGWNKVNNDYYYLLNGKLLRNDVLNEKGKIYVFDSDGIMLKNQITYMVNGYYWLGSDGKARTGWIQDGNAWYYAEPADAQLVIAASKTISGKEYYFDDYGIMVTSGILLDGKLNNYGSNGILSSTGAVADGWTYSNGYAYYYKSGKAYTGWVGSYYCEDGVMLTSATVMDGGAYYYLDDDGKYVKNRWIDSMYAKSNGKLANSEWLDIEGNRYYFDGRYKVTGITNIDGEKYLFDADGRFIEKVASDMTKGWKKKNGSYYYSVDGSYAYSEGLYIDGKWYYFDYTGKMVTDEVVAGYYYGTNGSRQAVKGWKQIGGKWYYFNNDNCAAYGWNLIGGGWYYFSGYEMVTGYTTINGRLYYFNNSGKLDQEYTKNNGWYKADGKYYYFENSKLVTGGNRIIDGNMYAFDSYGVMISGSVAYTANGLRYFNASGKEVTTAGWYTVSAGKIYVGKGGEVYTGVRKIDGKLYYFTYSGILVS